jgi:hypothetical protein
VSWRPVAFLPAAEIDREFVRRVTAFLRALTVESALASPVRSMQPCRAACPWQFNPEVDSRSVAEAMIPLRRSAGCWRSAGTGFGGRTGS